MSSPAANGPLLTVIIPAYNRPGPLKATLLSVADAAAALPPGSVEVLIVDDGSRPPIAEQLAGFESGLACVFVPQANAGSIVARLHGLARASGEFIQFLDSDDLVHPDKFRVQLGEQQRAGADVSYCDGSEAAPGPDHRAHAFTPSQVLPAVDEAAELFLRVQPLPHSPIYRRSYLQAALAEPAVPARRSMDASGDVWLYYNLGLHPARILKVDGPFAAVGVHVEERFSRHWEKLAFCSLLIVEAFMASTARRADADALRARRVAGEVAFSSWRRLPHDFDRTFSLRLLQAWRQAPHGSLDALGGRGFRLLARLLGPVAAARLLRRLRGGPYAACRTLDAEALARLLATAP